ncbi:hypothetical protein ColTof4_02803 [Colletotrichum tofieldiae]|nr:hypothetical protein ColTof3_08900 [Colletotrichum tofieldiae]GKT70380.1 hypothetical protein ColTof4_02803 [Colletotrichum tofieldiae]GKT93443.1 hypothetical protein Ct61P_11293 [Colletotrichum tofieldiae]
MSDQDGRQSPEFAFVDDEGRAKIKQYKTSNKFRTGDFVYLYVAGGGREGPFVVASSPTPGRYTLSLENGQAVKNGQEVDEKSLTGA